MNSIALMTWQSRCVDLRKDRWYEGLMLRIDEDKKGPSYRTKGHIKINMHLGMGELFVAIPWIHVVDNCQSEYQKPQSGVLKLGKMRWTRLGVGKI